jgi:hypothetical protein
VAKYRRPFPDRRRHFDRDPIAASVLIRFFFILPAVEKHNLVPGVELHAVARRGDSGQSFELTALL